MGKIQWTVKELRDMLEDEPDNAVVFAIWHDDNEGFHERPIYKNSTAADDTKHYLYLGDENTS